MAKKKKSNIVNQIRGAEREAHFKDGGTPAMWRGLHQVHSSKNEKRRSRRTDKQKNINDSDEG